MRPGADREAGAVREHARRAGNGEISAKQRVPAYRKLGETVLKPRVGQRADAGIGVGGLKAFQELKVVGF
jgi:hypothetical protein